MLNLNCIICAELFGQADDVHVTTCGHMFHYLCLTQWLERSKTCPQCRNKCNPRNIFRLYFNLANLDTSQIDIGSLQEQLDNLKLQLQLKEKEVHKNELQVKTLKESQKKCMKTICALETKLEKKEFIINSYTDQVNILKADVRVNEDLRKEVKTLRQRLETIEGVSSILTASNAEAEKMLKTESDPKKLCVWLATLKRELVNCENKKTDMRNVLRVVQNDLRREIDEKKKLEERISQLESECYQLNNELESLKRPVAGSSKATLNNRLSTNSEHGFKNAALDSLQKEEKRLTISPTIKENVRKIEESDSPYLNIKSSSVGFMPYNFKRKADISSNTKETSGTTLTKLSSTKFAKLKISPNKLSNSTTAGVLRKTSSDIAEKYSIFKKPRLALATNVSGTKSSTNLVFNGFGGSDKIDPFARNPSDDELDFHEKSKVNKISAVHLKSSKTIKKTNSSSELLVSSDDDVEIVDNSKTENQCFDNQNLKIIKKTNPISSSSSLSERLKSGGLRNFMVQKTQKK